MELKIFNNAEFGKVRAVEIDGEGWLVGKDVAEVLGYSDVNKAIAMHVDAEDKKLNDKTSPSFGQRGAHLINESGFYSLVLGSKLPTAKKFKHWVTSEVLPSIRKHGAYMTEETLKQVIQQPEFLIQLATELKKEQELNRTLQAENDTQAQQIAEFKPKADYVDRILRSTDTLATSQVAADYGLSAQALNKILHDQCVQYCVSGQWLLYQKHRSKGYTKSETIDIVHSDGSLSYKLHTKWTQKGRLFIHNILTKLGYQANIDKEAK